MMFILSERFFIELGKKGAREDGKEGSEERAQRGSTTGKKKVGRQGIQRSLGYQGKKRRG